MDKIMKTPPRIPTSDEETTPLTPPPAAAKTPTPDRLKVPKPFKYPERYTSPTDQMMSPVTRGILAISKKGSKLLPPSVNQPKVRNINQEIIESTTKGATINTRVLY
ncbi:hypothetical protein ACS0TY_029110 [Phlomoides rotata]